ncbi:MAG TPA: hypothetical protein PLC42_04895 [Parachlamydiaceae bacterium]|nr:hypothetical protein [Parachlamydiaceae bacterium]
MGKPITFNGEQLPKNEETAKFFTKHSFPPEKGVENQHRSGELIVNGKNLKNLENLKGFNAKSPVDADAIKQATAETREARFAKIESLITNGKASIAVVNHEKKVIEFAKLDKKTDLTQAKNTFIIAGNNIVPLNINEHPSDFAEYQFITKDKSLEKDFNTIKQNFINGNVFIATGAELKTLNDINHNRTQETKIEDKKLDHRSSQDIQQKRESNVLNPAIQPKVQTEISKKRKTIERENVKSSFTIDEEKTAKADQLKRSEEIKEEKQESAHQADRKNQENIDERVLNRNKQKN